MRKTRLSVCALAAGSLIASSFAVVPAQAKVPRCRGQKATIVGTKKGEEIVGTRKRDVIVAKGGRDDIYGRGGGDTICAGGGADVVLGGGGADEIAGGGKGDLLLGEKGADVLLGQKGSDSILGGPGDDVVDLGGGDFQFGMGEGDDDTIRGGKGFDFTSFYTAPGPVTVDLALGFAEGEGSDQLIGIDGTEGSSFDDVLRGDSGTNFIFGLAGNDSISTGGNAGDTAGPEAVTQFLYDFVDGDAFLQEGEVPGDDTIVGGDGLNVVTFEENTQGVTVDLDAGTATGQGSDTLNGMQAVVGTMHDDTFIGSEASDLFDGRGGNDSMDGAGDRDVLILFDFQNALVNLSTSSATGDAIFYTETGTFAVPASYTVAGLEDVWGSQFPDNITGDDNDNRFYADLGADILNGLAGDDFLDGDGGSNTMDGGDDIDACVGRGTAVNCETVSGNRASGRTVSGVESYGDAAELLRSRVARLRRR